MKNSHQEHAAFERLLTEVEASNLLGFKPRALQYWRHKGTGPSFIRVSVREIRYRESDLLSWVEALAVDGTPSMLDGIQEMTVISDVENE